MAQVQRFDRIIVSSPAEGEVPVTVVQRDVGETADLMQFQRSDGTVLARVDSDGDFIPGASHDFSIPQKAGAPIDGDYTTPVDGMMVVDSTNSKLWVRVGGAWKGVVIA